MDEKTELREGQEKREMQQEERNKVPQPYYSWPTSKPGPFETPPPPGQRIMPSRTDQVIEVEYNQETGEPSTSDPRKWNVDETTTGLVGFDQQETAQEIERKREQK